MDDWVVISGAGGAHRELLDITQPFNKAWASYWRMDYLELAEMRVSWDKVQAIWDALSSYSGGVIWIDADAMVVSLDHDIRHDAPANWNWVVHPVEGGVPNCGVLVVRPEADRFLIRLLNIRGSYEAHPWWEQGAAMYLLGYEPRPGGITKARAPQIDPGVHEMPLNWNVLVDRTPCDDPWIIHASGMAMSDRKETLQRAAMGETVWMTTS
jgi:hypothetical protein